MNFAKRVAFIENIDTEFVSVVIW